MFQESIQYVPQVKTTVGSSLVKNKKAHTFSWHRLTSIKVMAVSASGSKIRGSVITINWSLWVLQRTGLNSHLEVSELFFQPYTRRDDRQGGMSSGWIHWPSLSFSVVSLAFCDLLLRSPARGQWMATYENETRYGQEGSGIFLNSRFILVCILLSTLTDPVWNGRYRCFAWFSDLNHSAHTGLWVLDIFRLSEDL